MVESLIGGPRGSLLRRLSMNGGSLPQRLGKPSPASSAKQMGVRFLLEAAEDRGKGVGIERGELGSLYPMDLRSAARQLAGSR
jgi:hypothetical protein